PKSVVPPRAWRGNPRPLAVVLWVLTVAVGTYMLGHSRWWFADPPETSPERRRPHDAGGYTQIDFGGQGVLGRMLVRGYGRELYHRQRQWEVVRAGYPVENEPLVQRVDTVGPVARRRIARPDEELRHDADWLMHWVMGKDSPHWRTVGGAVAAPLALDP